MRMNMQMNKQNVEGGFEAIATLEDLGRYLRELREKRHVTQESLSTKIGAVTGRKIARSRSSEIENARRDWVTDRELRAYMCGLKCMPRHIDQVVTVLTQCTGRPAGESPAGPEATSPATLDAGDPASPPQPPRRRWRRPRIVLAAALAQVFVVFAGLGVGWSLRGESGDRSMSPDGTPVVRVSQQSTEAGESRNRGAGGAMPPAVMPPSSWSGSCPPHHAVSRLPVSVGQARHSRAAAATSSDQAPLTCAVTGS